MNGKYEINEALLLTIINLLRRLPMNDVEGVILQLQTLEEISPIVREHTIGFQAQMENDDADNEI